MTVLRLRSVLVFCFLIFITARCQIVATPSAEPPTPTPNPFPPIQPGDGTDVLDQLLERGLIRVGIRVWPEPEFSPPAFRGILNAQTGGALAGFEIETAQLIAAGLGLDLEFIQADPRVILSGNWSGEWDIAMATLAPVDQPPTAPSGPSLVYSTPYAYMPMGVLVPAAEDSIETFDQLAGQRIGVLEHTIYQRLLTVEEGQAALQRQLLMPQPPPDIQLVVLSNVQMAIRQLGQTDGEVSSNIDAIFGPTPILQQAVERDLPVILAPEADNIGIHPMAVAAVPRDNLTVDRLMAEINGILSRLRQQGNLAEIHLKWYGRDLSHLP